MKVLKFGAIWCTECIVMKSIWDEIEDEIFDFDTEYFDADEHQDIFAEHEVETIPTYVFLDDGGNEVERLKGIQNKDDIIDIINENLEQ